MTSLRVPILADLERPAAAVYEIDPLSDPRWVELIDRHPRASVFHSQQWLRALNAAYHYEPIVLTRCAPGSPLTNGLVACQIRSWLTGRRVVSLPFSDHCEPLVDSQAELDVIVDQLKRETRAGDWKYIEIRPVTLEPSARTGLIRFDTYHLQSLDLGLSEERLFRNFHRDCIQRKIHRAERENLKYEEGASEALLQTFYRLAVMTRRRQKLPPQPLNWFRALASNFGNDLKIRVVSKDGLPVASILTLSHKKSMIYKYGCSNAAFNNLGGMALLFWKTVQDAKASGFEELDMGRSDIDNLGLVTFKEHLGASRRLINYWTYPRSSAGLPSLWRKKLAGHLVAALPDLALEIVGDLLYRHVG